MLTDPGGRPVAVRVVRGDTADPVAFTEIVAELPATFGLTDLVLVGDRGMITSARIGMLRELNDNPTPQPISGGSPRCGHRRSPNSPVTTGHCR
ncbi:hypothetical protein MLAC_12590 [Mycobacterium lacus]|uniref:Transposase IS4-like domain-containing protein n=1 Tax=Mycobacterium lacus TaxID=169765 RepID=A0A7I7NH52_9MYCO|nr:hypothetical protein [Mycobacterium lacus]BBX95965.1 hypothetical protein MLAC_12590 [Mycobacterium lacus]